MSGRSSTAIGYLKILLSKNKLPTKFEEEMGIQFCNFKIAHKEGTCLQPVYSLHGIRIILNTLLSKKSMVLVMKRISEI